MRGRPTRIRGLIALALIASFSGPARARPFRIGEVEGVANLELSYGLLARLEGRDEELIAIASGGESESANSDDGDLNYDEGVASNVLQASGEVFARWRHFAAYARGIAFYDFENELAERERTDFSNDASRLVGTDLELREYHLDADFEVRGMPVHLRVGDQVLNWGEGGFLRFGVQTMNPLDLAALGRPASTARDLPLPQGMLWAAANLTEEIAVEAYYQYDWDAVRTPPVGAYFSDSDPVGGDGLGATLAGGGLFSDLGSDLDSFFALPEGTLGFDEDFMRIPGHGSREARSQGQGGISVQAILPRLNSTKLALHFVNYHSRLPVLGARTASQPAVDATSPANVAARAALLEPIYESEGLSPAEAALAASRTASTLTVGEYASETSYFVEYPEDVQMLGFSFNTATLQTGTLLSGEVSHHFGQPFQILSGDVFNAAFSPIQFDPSFGEGPLGDHAANEEIDGSIRLDKTQLEVGLRQLLGPRLGASQSLFGVDFGWIHVHDLPDESELRLSAPGITGPDDFGHLPDADSWGYRVLAALVYEGVLGAFSVQPHLAWLHDVGGVTPGPGGAFVEGRKAVSVGVSVDYTSTWLLQLDYTTLFGAGRFNTQNDRDFLRFQLTYYY